MMVEKAPRINFAEQLELATQKIVNLKEECETEHKRVSTDIKGLISTLTSCNTTIDNTITQQPDNDTITSIQHFLEITRSFNFNSIEHQKETIEKINKLNPGLFGQLFNQIQKLETNLKNWRYGTKVSKAYGGKGSDSKEGQ